MLRYATAAGQRAEVAGFGSHREAAAKFARALRFAAGAPPAEVAGLHVSAVLAKLGTPTRAAASAEAARRGLVATPAR